MVKVGIIGATGYAGNELVRLILGHKDVEIVWLGSRSYTISTSLCPRRSLTNSLPAYPVAPIIPTLTIRPPSECLFIHSCTYIIHQ